MASAIQMVGRSGIRRAAFLSKTTTRTTSLLPPQSEIISVKRQSQLCLTSLSALRNRYFSAAAVQQDDDGDAAVETVPVTYIYPDGEKVEARAEIGKHLLDVAHDNAVDLEGACGGELACATCHCIFEQSIYDTLPEKLEEEEDMLDLAIDLQDTSRLGCQVRVTKELAGVQIQLPRDDM